MPVAPGGYLDRRWRCALEWPAQDLQGTLLAPAAPSNPPDGRGYQPHAPRGYPRLRALGEPGPPLVLTTLAGQDTIYGAPGQVPDYDWPVPRGYHRAQPLGEAPPPLVLGPLAGQDQMFGAPGEVPDFDWPLPVLRIKRQQPQQQPSLLETTLAPVVPLPAGQALLPAAIPRVRRGKPHYEQRPPLVLLLTVNNPGCVAIAVAAHGSVSVGAATVGSVAAGVAAHGSVSVALSSCG